jgi:hypothetical protein
MGENLETTNLLLAVMAVVSALEGVLLIGVAVAAWSIYRRATVLMNTLESRHVAPAMAHVNDILEDVRRVTATVRNETERVDQAVHRTFDRVDHTVDRVRTNVRVKTSRVIGLVRGARVALQSILQGA